MERRKLFDLLKQIDEAEIYSDTKERLHTLVERRGGGPYRAPAAEEYVSLVEAELEKKTALSSRLMDRVVELESSDAGSLRVHDVTKYGIGLIFSLGFVTGTVLGVMLALRLLSL